MYGFVRLLLAGAVATLVLLAFFIIRSSRKRNKVCVVIAISALCALGIAMIITPFENQLGGFDSVKKEIEYKHGKCELIYSYEVSNTVLSITDKKVVNICHVEDGRFYIVSSGNILRKHSFLYPARLMVYGDKRSLERFAVVTFFPEGNEPVQITDNKGTYFGEGFVFQGITFYIGNFIDDGFDYEIYINGESTGSMSIG